MGETGGRRIDTSELLVLARRITTSLDRAVILANIVEGAGRLLGGAALLMLRAPEGDLRSAASHGLPREEVGALRARSDIATSAALEELGRTLGRASFVASSFPASGPPEGLLVVYIERPIEPGDQDAIAAIAEDAEIAFSHCRAFEICRAQADAAKQSEERIAAARALFEAVLEQMPAGLAVAEAPSGKLISMNRAFKEIWRRPVDPTQSVDDYGWLEVLGLDGSHRSPAEYPLTRALRGGETISEEDYLIVRGDGTRVRVRCSAAPVRDASGQVIAAVLTFNDVTGRARHEASLRESEEISRLLVEGVRDYAIFMLDTTGRVASWNAGAERATGYRAEDILGRSTSIFYPQEAILQGKHEAPLRVAAERGTYEEEGFRLRKDGTRFWASVLLTAIRDANGKLRGFSNIVRDNTERKLFEEASAESSRRTGMILESISDAFCGLDRDWRFTFINPEAERLLERKRGDVVGRTFAEAFPELVGTKLHEEMVRAARERKRHDFEQWFPPLGRCFELRAYPSEVGLSLYFRDVTEQRSVERAQRFLADSGRRLAESLDYNATLETVAWLPIPDFADWCIVLVMENGEQRVAVAHHDPVECSHVRSMFERFPLNPDADVGLGLVFRTGEAELVPEVTEPYYALLGCSYDQEWVDDFRRIGPISTMSVPLRVRGTTLGVMRLISTRGCRHYGKADLGLAEEVGRRAALAIANAQLYRTAHAAIQAREDVVSIASHDLRSPLTTLKLRAEMTLATARRSAAKGGMPQAVIDGLESVQAQAVRMNGLLEFLLDVSRISSGRVELRVEETDATTLVGQAVARVEERAKSAGSSIAFIAPGPVVGRWDPMRLEQIISNLLSNAIQYGAGRPIEVTLADQGETFGLVVTDHGIGIAESDLGHIFDRFRRGGALHERGFGLGLWIVRRIVESSGGRITAESKLGEGSTFAVTLPRDLAPEKSSASSQNAA